MAQQFVTDTVAGNAVVVFSKSWCPYCKMAKDTLREAGVTDYTVIELEERGV